MLERIFQEMEALLEVKNAADRVVAFQGHNDHDEAVAFEFLEEALDKYKKLQKRWPLA
jgi:hypothetical protein